MSDSKYVGRGEVRVKKMLERLFECEVAQQVNIKKIIYAEDYDFLDEEVQNHNFDLVMIPTHGRPVVIEVNYFHGEKIAQKLRQVIVPLIRKRGYDYLEINDWDCEKRGLFWQNTKKEHPPTWDDYRDLMNALQTCNINPEFI